MKGFSSQALGDTEISNEKLFLPSGKIWKFKCFFPLVNEKGTALLACKHGNGEASQLVQREMPPPNCHGGHKAQEDTPNCKQQERES